MDSCLYNVKNVRGLDMSRCSVSGVKGGKCGVQKKKVITDAEGFQMLRGVY